MSGPGAAWLGWILYGGAIGLVVVGLVAMVTRRHLLRIVLGLTLLEAGVNLFIVTVGFRPGAAAPILEASTRLPMVDPLPQALILTAIVIGVGVLALALALIVRVYAVYGTLDVRALAGRIEAEAPEAAGVPVPAGGARPAPGEAGA